MKSVFIRRGDVLVPATQYDLDQLYGFKNGEAVNIDMKSKKKRSQKMHRMYFGGLLRLAVDYWESDAGFLSRDEKKFAVGLSEFVKSMGYDSSSIEIVMKMYMHDLIEMRKSMIPDCSTANQIEQIHKWVKIECGYFDLVKTPDGIIKSPKSISFDSMSHDRWMVFYKNAFNIIWNFVLSRVFDSEEDCHQAINRLSGMG